jgi:hypothetical protein
MMTVTCYDKSSMDEPNSGGHEGRVKPRCGRRGEKITGKPGVGLKSLIFIFYSVSRLEQRECQQ